jgi:hypothetical protein
MQIVLSIIPMTATFRVPSGKKQRYSSRKHLRISDASSQSRCRHCYHLALNYNKVKGPTNTLRLRKNGSVGNNLVYQHRFDYRENILKLKSKLQTIFSLTRFAIILNELKRMEPFKDLEGLFSFLIFKSSLSLREGFWLLD